MQLLTTAIAAAILAFTTTAAPTTLAARSPTLLPPTTLSQYSVWTGAITFSTPTGKIFKNGRVSDITTLVTFDIPSAATGKTCELHFLLDTPSSSTIVSGSAQFDVFTSLAPATASTTGWPSGNLRDQYVGRMVAQAGGEAVWAQGFPDAGRSFPCPDGGERLAGELVGTGDVDDVEWVQSAAAGPYILFY